eukprot:7379851-Prymnesium_polylepis.8
MAIILQAANTIKRLCLFPKRTVDSSMICSPVSGVRRFRVRTSLVGPGSGSVLVQVSVLGALSTEASVARWIGSVLHGREILAWQRTMVSLRPPKQASRAEAWSGSSDPRKG